VLILSKEDILFGPYHSKEGIVVDPEKIKTIEGCPSPNNFSEVRSFMGIAHYYNRFIEGFSRIAHPITSLQTKGVNFEWPLNAKNCFNI
jgi:hypothetical protein